MGKLRKLCRQGENVGADLRVCPTGRRPQGSSVHLKINEYFRVRRNEVYKVSGGYQ